MQEAVKQITVDMKSRYLSRELPRLIETTIRNWLGFNKLKSSQCKNISPEMQKFEPDKEDYCKDQLLDAWNMCICWHMEIMGNKNIESKLYWPASLTRLVIKSCSITNDALSTCIQCLVFLSELHLIEIQTITSLPPEVALRPLKNLSILRIEHCYLLSSLGGICALTSLTELIMEFLLNLKNSSNDKLPSSLETLQFVECANFGAILDQSDLPLLLKFTLIKSREDRVLKIGRMRSLKDLRIIGWKGRIEGLNSLISLNTLTVIGSETEVPFSVGKCSIVVVVDNPVMLKQMLLDETISSLEFLEIAGFEGDSMDGVGEVFQSLTSLQVLSLNLCKITHLPVQLKELTALQTIYLTNCPNLCEVEHLPNNLRNLLMKDCPVLLEKFNKGGSHLLPVGFDHEGYTVVPMSLQMLGGSTQRTNIFSCSRCTSQHCMSKHI